MTPRPPTHREPTDAEMQCLPEGALWLDGYKWEPSNLIGKEVVWTKQDYAVPISQQDIAEMIERENLAWSYRHRSWDEWLKGVPSENPKWLILHGYEIRITKQHSAIPITQEDKTGLPTMTLRDEFAMAALTGELASSSTAESAEATAKAAEKAGLEPAQYLAKLCYEIADAMLAARNQTA